jgi:signal transduction histidine kinase
MRFPRSLLRHPRSLLPRVSRDGAGPVTGPAMTALVSVVQRGAATLRTLGLGYLGLQLAIWHSWYAASPVRLWAPAVALGWGALALARLRRGRPRGLWVAVDSAVYAGLALTAAGCVPPPMRGQPGDWLYIVVTTQLVVPTWFAARPLSAALPLLSALSYSAGTVLGRADRAPGSSAAGSCVLLVAIVVAHWTGHWLLRRRAVAADAALAAAEAQAREQYVALARNLARREQDRLLHDTVLNTLTAIARSGPAGGVAARCRHDLALLRRAQRESAASPGQDGLAGRLRVVADEMRARDLAVHLEWSGDAGREIPEPVAAAMADATREALANVAAHAGTGAAWVRVAGTPGSCRVTIHDAGRGFDPGRIDPARLGVRRSIGERVADCGGSATVISAPGAGTEVCLRWPAAAAPVPASPARTGSAPASPHPLATGQPC